jgi:hypothetical protein
MRTTAVATYITTDLRSTTLALPGDLAPPALYVDFAAQGSPQEPQAAYRLTAPLLAHLLAVATGMDARHQNGELSAAKLAAARDRMARIVDAANAELDPRAVADAVRLASDDPERFAAMLDAAIPETDGALPPRDPFRAWDEQERRRLMYEAKRRAAEAAETAEDTTAEPNQPTVALTEGAAP